VDEIDSLSIDPSTNPRAVQPSAEASPTSSISDPVEGLEMSEKLMLDEKPIEARPDPPAILPKRLPRLKSNWRMRIQAHLPRMRVPRILIYVRLFFLPISPGVKRKHEEQPKHIFERSTMLKRITDTRRLVAGLSRLLGAKHQVIGRLRKRGAEVGGGVEAYLGDVEGEYRFILVSVPVKWK